jgi:hypothetical protein
VAETINAGKILFQEHNIHERESATVNEQIPNLMYLLIMNTVIFEETF